MNVDYLLYYDTERYLFGTVTQRFQQDGFLNAVDFFTIVRWKANRAISRVSDRLLRHDPKPVNLDSAVEALTRAIHDASTAKDRLRVLIEDWKFHLPMASAILTVCYPDEFSVYDVRVRDVLGVEPLAETLFDKMWCGYQEYLNSVRQKAPANLNLRDKDRWLWAKSAYHGLEMAIACNFQKKAQGEEPATRA